MSVRLHSAKMAAKAAVRVFRGKTRVIPLGDLADGALRKALNQSQPLEARRRIEALLALPRLVRTNEARRSLRATRVLERIGTPEAKQALETLAKGAAESKITQEAKVALDRLTKRFSVSP